MPITYKGNVAYFTQGCSLDDAQSLHEWFLEHPKGKINLKNCSEMHTAVLQILLASSAPITVDPLDEQLAKWLPNEVKKPHKQK